MSKHIGHLKLWSSVTVAIICLSGVLAFAAETRKIDIDLTEGTWISLDVSPDGKQIAFDLLGDIYAIPVGGGEATRLTTLPKLVPSGADLELPNKGQGFDSQPRYSPDGKSIVFISDRDGSDNIYIMNADGSGLRQITNGRDRFASPAWSPDGKYIAVRRQLVGGGRGEGAGLYIYRVEGGPGYKLDIGKLGVINGPEFSRSGNALYFASVPEGSRSSSNQIMRFDRDAGKTIQLTKNFGGAIRPRFSPDGKWMAYATYSDGETELRVRELSTGRERLIQRPIEHDVQLGGNRGLDNLPNYAFSPDGQFVYLAYLGKIHRVSVGDGKNQEIPFHVKTTLEIGPKLHLAETPLQDNFPVRMLRFTQFSPDSRTIVFDALGKIWSVDSNGGQPQRLTKAREREYEPAISPDGQWVAYVTWSDAKLGQVCKVSIHGGEPVVLTKEPGFYVNPNWSPDGKRISVGVGDGAELRGSEPNQELSRTLSWLPSDGGPLHTVTTLNYPASDANIHIETVLDLAGRFNKDGKRLWYMYGNELHSVRLDGLDDRVHLKLGNEDGGEVANLVVPSPDEEHVAFIAGNNEVWVMPMPWSTATPVTVDIHAKSIPGLRKVSGIAGFYPTWIGNDELAWSFAGKVYRHKLASKEKASAITVDLKASVPAAKGTVVLRGARLITMTGDQVIEKGTVVIQDNRIVDVGPSANVHVPSGAKVLDVSGKTIIPGLLDIHDHIISGNQIRNFPEQDRFFAAALSYGITAIRDPSAANSGAFYFAELVNSGQMIGPRAYTTGEPLVPPIVDVRSLQEALDVVEQQKDLGAIMLKQYTQPTRRQRALIQEAARQLGIMSTAEGGIDYKYNFGMLLDGFIGTEHLWAYHPLYGDVAQVMAKTGFFYTPTLGTSASGSEHWYHLMDVDHDPKQQHFLLHSAREHLWRRIVHQKIDVEWDTVYWSSVRSANRMLQGGANVAMGSHDEPTPTGLGSHWELWDYVDGGMTPLQAIRCGTITSADAIGMAKDLGSLEKGKMADLIILNANPLDDIKNSIKIDRVMQNGFLYDGNTLDEVWPESHKLAPLWVSQE